MKTPLEERLERLDLPAPPGLRGRAIAAANAGAPAITPGRGRRAWRPVILVAALVFAVGAVVLVPLARDRTATPAGASIETIMARAEVVARVGLDRPYHAVTVSRAEATGEVSVTDDWYLADGHERSDSWRFSGGNEDLDALVQRLRDSASGGGAAIGQLVEAVASGRPVTVSGHSLDDPILWAYSNATGATRAFWMDQDKAHTRVRFGRPASAASLQELVAAFFGPDSCHEVTLLREEVVFGRPAYVVRIESSPDACSASVSAERRAAAQRHRSDGRASLQWLDAETLLPLRTQGLRFDEVTGESVTAVFEPGAAIPPDRLAYQPPPGAGVIEATGWELGEAWSFLHGTIYRDPLGSVLENIMARLAGFSAPAPYHVVRLSLRETDGEVEYWLTEEWYADEAHRHERSWQFSGENTPAVRTALDAMLRSLVEDGAGPDAIAAEASRAGVTVRFNGRAQAGEVLWVYSDESGEMRALRAELLADQPAVRFAWAPVFASLEELVEAYDRDSCQRVRVQGETVVAGRIAIVVRVTPVLAGCTNPDMRALIERNGEDRVTLTWLDADTMVPLKVEGYEGMRFLSRTEVLSFVPYAALADSTFEYAPDDGVIVRNLQQPSDSALPSGRDFTDAYEWVFGVEDRSSE